MPDWAVLAIVVGGLLLAAAAAALGWLAWRAYERKALLRLVVRAEGVEAIDAALEDTVERLSRADDDALREFADDPNSSERRALDEVATRSRLLVEELDRMPLPAKLAPVADAIADAAFLVGRQASVLGDDDVGPAALDKLGEVDLLAPRQYATKARLMLVAACDACGLEETAVYGGGLYL